MIRNFSSRSQTIFLGQRVWPIFENSFEHLFDRMPRIAWNCCNRVTSVKVATNDPCALQKEEIYRGTDGRSWKVFRNSKAKSKSFKNLESEIISIPISLDRDERNEKLRRHVCWIKKVKVFFVVRCCERKLGRIVKRDTRFLTWRKIYKIIFIFDSFRCIHRRRK